MRETSAYGAALRCQGPTAAHVPRFERDDGRRDAQRATRGDALFHYDRFFVKQLAYNGTEIYVTFSNPRFMAFDFKVKIWKPMHAKPIGTWSSTWVPSKPLQLSAKGFPERVVVQLTVNGHIALDAPVSAQQLYTS